MTKTKAMFNRSAVGIPHTIKAKGMPTTPPPSVVLSKARIPVKNVSPCLPLLLIEDRVPVNLLSRVVKF